MPVRESAPIHPLPPPPIDPSLLNTYIARNTFIIELLTYGKSFVQVGVLVNVNVTDPFRVPEHRDVCTLILDTANQFTGSTGDDQIDVIFHGQ